MSSSKKNHELFSKHFKLAFAAEEENQDEKEAFTNFQKCYEIDPKNREAKQKYLSYFKKNFERENNKKSQDELKLMGNAFIQQQKFEEAIIAYTAAIDLDPSVEAAAAIYSNRSLCCYNTKKYQEAYDDGSMASVLRPEWPRGWMRRAAAAIKIENYQDAHECYEKYFELDPDASAEDGDAVKNKNLAKKELHQMELEKKRTAERIKKHREHFKSIEHNKPQLQDVAGRAFLTAMQSNTPTEFDSAMLRLIVEFIPDMNKIRPPAALAQQGIVPETLSILGALAYFRAMTNFCKKTLAQFDEAILMVIEEMEKRKLPLPDSVLSFACDSPAPDVGFFIPPNPDIILALLKTGQVDPNEISPDEMTPLASLVVSSQYLNEDGLLYPEVVKSIEALLGWKGIDVNRRTKIPAGMQLPIVAARHPEIVKLLLRHGADVNAECDNGGTIRRNALHQAIEDKENPHQTDLIRTLIAAGAKLIADGKKGKSAIAMTMLFDGRDGNQVSEDCIQLLLQLNKSQGLEMRYRSTDNSINQSFLITAIRRGASVRTIELLCGMDPSVINEASDMPVPFDGSTLQLTPIECVVIFRTRMFGMDDTVNVLRVLFTHGADLMCKSKMHSMTTVFSSVACHLIANNYPRKPISNVIEEKFGKEFLDKCLDSRF